MKCAGLFLLPLIIAVLGLGSGAFMVATMPYRSIFLPAGVIGVGLGYDLYSREKRRCSSIGCAFAGAKSKLILVLLAAGIVAAAFALDLVQQLTSGIVQTAM